MDRPFSSMDATLPAHKVKDVGKPTPPPVLDWALFGSSRPIFSGIAALGRLDPLSTAPMGILSNRYVGHRVIRYGPLQNPASSLRVIVTGVGSTFPR